MWCAKETVWFYDDWSCVPMVWFYKYIDFNKIDKRMGEKITTDWRQIERGEKFCDKTTKTTHNVCIHLCYTCIIQLMRTILHSGCCYQRDFPVHHKNVLMCVCVWEANWTLKILEIASMKSRWWASERTLSSWNGTAVVHRIHRDKR